jgi:CheY-like chemotaxis protein
MRVLVIEDDSDFRDALTYSLPRQGCSVQAVETRDAAIELMEKGWEPDLILLDYCMPGMKGEDFIQKLVNSCERLPRIVVMTAGCDAEKRAKHLGVPEVLRKPFDPTELLLQIEWYAV